MSMSGVVRTGEWLHPGRKAARLHLVDDGRVMFQSEPGVEATPPHGHWSTYGAGDDCVVLEVTFHHRGDDAVSKLRNHLFYELCPGVYRMTDESRLLLFRDDVDVIGDELVVAAVRRRAAPRHAH